MECEYVVSHKSKNETSSLVRCGAGGLLAMKTNAKSLKATKALAGKVEMLRNVTVLLDTLYSINQKVKKPKLSINYSRNFYEKNCIENLQFFRTVRYRLPNVLEIHYTLLLVYQFCGIGNV